MVARVILRLIGVDRWRHGVVEGVVRAMTRTERRTNGPALQTLGQFLLSVFAHDEEAIRTPAPATTTTGRGTRASTPVERCVPAGSWPVALRLYKQATSPC